MRIHRSFTLATAALGLPFGLSATGCTLLGAAAGAGYKTPGSGAMRPGSLSEVPRLVAADRVILHLRDGRTISGRVDSLYSREGPEYEQLYAAYQKTNTEGQILPNIGAIQLLLQGRREPESVQFVGLEPTGIVFRNKRGAQKTAPFESVRLLQSEAQTIDVKALQSVAASGSVPSLTEIHLTDPGAKVALNEVASIEYGPKKRNVLRGAGLGFLIDLILTLLTLSGSLGGLGG